MKNFSLPFALLTALMVSCTGRYTRNLLKDVYTYIGERPDSALAVLHTIDTTDLRGRSKADYHLLMAMAMDKNYIDVASDSIVRPAVEYFGKHGPRNKCMLSLYYLGTSQYYAGYYNEAIITLDQSEELAVRENNLLYKGLANSMKSSVCSMSHNNEDELAYAQKALECYKAIPDSFQVRRAMLLLANAYNNNSLYSESAAIYDDLIARYPCDTFLMVRSLVRGAYSLYRADPSRLPTAMSYFDRAMHDYHASFDIDEAAHYSELCYFAGRKEEALSVLSSLEQMGSAPEHVSYLKSVFYRLDGNDGKAFEALKQFLDNEQTAVASALNQSIVRAQRDYLRQSRLLSEEQLRNQRMVNTCIIALLLFLIAAVCAYVGHKRKQHQADNERLLSVVEEAEQQLVFSEIKNKTLEKSLVEARQQYVAAYKKQFHKLSSLLEKYYSTSGNKNGRDEVYKFVMNLASTVGKDRESMRALEKSINANLEGAMQLYREEFPGRDQEHYNYICYLMAGFTASMVALLTGLSCDNVYTKKTRILKEIARSEVPHKDLFLLTIK